MIKKWELLSSETVYQKKWMTIREESCLLPDGRVLDPYIIIDVPHFCNVFVVTENEEIVFVNNTDMLLVLFHWNCLEVW